MSDSSQSPARIGVFGGTFDPIHTAHIEIGRAALAQANLDRVLFVVAAVPPHKQDQTDASAEDRFAIVEAALESESGMDACRIELDRDGVSYTADTLATLHEQHPGAELFLIIGMDSLIDLPRWRDPDRILELAKLLVVPRPGEWQAPPELAGQYQLLDFEPIDVSSTDIRTRIEGGGPLDSELPAAAVKLIRAKGLYGSTSTHPTS